MCSLIFPRTQERNAGPRGAPSPGLATPDLRDVSWGFVPRTVSCEVGTAAPLGREPEHNGCRDGKRELVRTREFSESHHLLIYSDRAIDMAREFPHCNVVGVDLVPPQVHV